MGIFNTSAKLLAGATFILSGGVANAVNLVNGSFETLNPNAVGAPLIGAPVPGNYYSLDSFAPKKDWIQGWEVFNDTIAWIAGPYQGLTAQNQVRFLDLTDTQQSNPFGGIRQSVNLAANTNYTLSFWLGTSNSFNGNTQVQVLVGAGNNPFFFAAPSGAANNVWYQQSTVFNSGAGGLTPISILGWVGVDYIGIDNFSITAVPEPSSVAMLLAGIAAVGSVVARKRKQIS